MAMKLTSPSFNIDGIGWKKIGKGLLIAIGGAALTYVAEVIPGINFGVWTPVAVAVSAALINTGRKFLASY